MIRIGLARHRFLRAASPRDTISRGLPLCRYRKCPRVDKDRASVFVRRKQAACQTSPLLFSGALHLLRIAEARGVAVSKGGDPWRGSAKEERRSQSASGMRDAGEIRESALAAAADRVLPLEQLLKEFRSGLPVFNLDRRRSVMDIRA